VPRQALLSLLAAGGLVLVLAQAASASTCPDEFTPADELGIDRFERAVVCVTNNRRAAAGRPPFRANGTLGRAAVRHSDAMVSGGFFSHLAPGGRGLVDRVRASGYGRGAERWRVGENLRWSIRALSSPSEVVEAWLVSPPHRRLLLDGQFREVGVGAVFGAPVFQEPAGIVTVTALYGSRRD
jgi:uncharacterized protein YkwD